MTAHAHPADFVGAALVTEAPAGLTALAHPAVQRQLKIAAGITAALVTAAAMWLAVDMMTNAPDLTTFAFRV